MWESRYIVEMGCSHGLSWVVVESGSGELESEKIKNMKNPTKGWWMWRRWIQDVIQNTTVDVTKTLEEHMIVFT